MTVLTVDGYMDVTEFPNLFDKRVLQKRDRNGNPVFGKFCETITHFLGYPFFIKVKNFDLAKHIVAFDYHLEGIDCFDENHLKVYLSNLMNEPWVDGTSYWKVTLIHNYNDQAKTLIIMKWQHVLADGFAMRSVMDAVCLIENTLDPVIGGSNLTKHKSLDIKSMVSLKLSEFWETMKVLLFFPYELARFRRQVCRHEIKLWEKNANATVYEFYRHVHLEEVTKYLERGSSLNFKAHWCLAHFCLHEHKQPSASPMDDTYVEHVYTERKFLAWCCICGNWYSETNRSAFGRESEDLIFIIVKLCY